MTNKPALRVIPGGKGTPARQPPPVNLLAALVCRWLMSHVRVDPQAVDRLRRLAARGPIVFVMRYRSLVDYLLVSYVCLREGLEVPEFANNVSILLLRPVKVIASTLWRRLRAWRFFGRELRRFRDRDRCQRLVAQNQSVLIFMRYRSSGIRPFGLSRRAVSEARTGTDYLREIVHRLWDKDQHVALVPIAVLRGKGFRRRESRLAALLYAFQEAPGEVKRLVSLAWNRDNTQLSVGPDLVLRDFVEAHRREGEERVVRRLARVLQMFLYQEERVVWGPVLLPKREVRQQVLQGGELAAVVREVARQEREAEAKTWRRAGRYFDEMAADFHGSYFSILEYAFDKIWPRVFQGLEHTGLERVIDCVKKGPVVLVPCHRSHFDYLILSYIFHNNSLSPPHIAAGINLSFWPLGPLFRGAGAFFIRRSFEGDPLYKLVFRKYLAFLIREGYTQEFFIEGGRSRTGKILTPRLGMLSALVNAFVEGTRRDLYFVPVSIHYGRIVEEEAYSRELSGAEKEGESLWGLVRARALLRQKHGTAYVTFAAPISLNDALGGRRPRFREAEREAAVGEEKRRFIQKLGFRLLREVNEVTVAGATSVSSTVLLGAPHAGLRMRGFLVNARALVRYLRSRQVALTSSLERNMAADFRESIGFLEAGALIQRIPDSDGIVLHVPPQKRRTLDFYKNNTIHFFLLPALVARGLLAGLRGAALREEVSWWLEMFRWEFALPERGAVAAELDRLFEYFAAEGAIGGAAGDVVDPLHPALCAVAGVLDNFQEAYWVAARTLADLRGPTARKACIDRMRKRYEILLLLGEVRKPEGNSTITLGNALERLREMGVIVLDAAGKGRDRIVRPGPQFEQLPGLVPRLAPTIRLVGT